MARVHIADRDVHGIAELSHKESARFKRKPGAWRAPWPAQPPPRKAATNAEAEAEDLLLRATAAAIRKGNAS